MNEYEKGMVAHVTVSLESVLRKGFTLDWRIANVGLPWAKAKKWMHTPALLNRPPGVQRQRFLYKT